MDRNQQQLIAELLTASIPLFPDIFYYVAWIQECKQYVSLALSPLYRDFISDPVFIHIDFGEHLFKATCDQCVFLIPYDEIRPADAVGPNFAIRNKVNPTLTHVFYTSFKAEIEQKMKFKIDQKRLYAKTLNGWKEIEIWKKT